METVEIHSSHDLTARKPDERKPGNHTYQLNSRQFLVLQRDWLRKKEDQNSNLMIMTLNLDRIWITPSEAKEVESAIAAKRSSVELP